VVKKYVVRWRVKYSPCVSCPPQEARSTTDARGSMYTYDTALKYALELRKSIYNSNVRIVAIVG
jgi:hypothetical protein